MPLSRLTSSSKPATKETDAAGSSSSPNTKKMDINPRWKGYCFMVLTSLINFSSVANVNTNVDKAVSLSFGIVLFVFSLSILILEWISAAGYNNDKYQYAQAYDGKLE